MHGRNCTLRTKSPFSLYPIPCLGVSRLVQINRGQIKSGFSDLLKKFIEINSDVIALKLAVNKLICRPFHKFTFKYQFINNINNMVTIMGTNVSACLENFNLHDFNSLIIILIANFSYYLKMLLSRK